MSDEALALWRGTPLVDLQGRALRRRRASPPRGAATRRARGSHRRRPRCRPARRARPRARSAGRCEPVARTAARSAHAGPLRRGTPGRRAGGLPASRRELTEELGLEPGRSCRSSNGRSSRRIRSSRQPRSRPRARSRPPVGRTLLRVALLALLGALLVAAAAFGIVHAFGGTAARRRNDELTGRRRSGRNRIVEVVPVGNTPRGVAVGRASSGSRTAADGTISQIDKKKLSVVQTIGLGRAGHRPRRDAPGASGSRPGIDNGLVQMDARSGGNLGRATLSSMTKPRALTRSPPAPAAIWVATGGRSPQGRSRLAPAPRRFASHYGGGVNDVAVGGGSVWFADVAETRRSRVTGRPSITSGVENSASFRRPLSLAGGSAWAGRSRLRSDRSSRLWRNRSTDGAGGADRSRSDRPWDIHRRWS